MIYILLTSNLYLTFRPYVEDGVFPIINMTASALSSVELVKNAYKVLSTNINKTTA
jgi:hypothetical protein